MVKRSIKQDIRSKNFGVRNGNYEKNTVVKNQGTKQRGQRILGDLLAMGNQRAVSERRQLHDRSGKPEKTSWDILQKVTRHREEPLLDGNAHSVRYGETIHDGSEKPEKLNHQEEADSETFRHGQ